jgi:pimeloyl-ACP methyl ester carboxylesterase
LKAGWTSETSDFDKEMYMKAWTQPGAILNGTNYYKANMDATGWTGIVKVPTLVIWGMKDTALRPLLLDAMPDHVNDLKIVRVENASHNVMKDQPDIVISNIREFI